jgi:hypothetical protein
VIVNSPSVNKLLQHIEPLLALSTAHLSPTTRQKLAEDQLSVNAYPNDHGGFVYVGHPVYSTPTEPELAEIFKLAAQAQVVWLKFDGDAAIVDDLPVFDE